MRHLEIDLSAIEHNLAQCKASIGEGVGVIPVIKADAYGHGAMEVARVLETKGVACFAVAFPPEGAILRRGGIETPIIVLNADADSFGEVIRHGLEPEIYNFETLRDFVRLLQAGENYPIHLKLDTGMHRLGFRSSQLAELIEALEKAADRIKVATVFSHLAAADDQAEDDFTRAQITEFQQLSTHIVDVLGYPVKRHIANTNGIARFPEAQFDLVRLGLGLYLGIDDKHQAATLRTKVVNIGHLEKGDTVGYNRRGVITKNSTIATIPIGYADGFDRRLSNGRWSVLVDGQPAPIVGNVCMDSLMVDITGLDGVKVGGEVSVFSPAEGNTIEDMAAALGTIPYEVMTGISARLKRVYVR